MANPTLVLAASGATFAVNEAPQPAYLNLCSADGADWLHADVSDPLAPKIAWITASDANQTPAVQWVKLAGNGWYRCAPAWPNPTGVAATVKILGPAPTPQG